MISIYIHIPFCLKKCMYCGFTSVAAANTTTQTRYIEAVCKEAKLISKTHNLNAKPVLSVFFGGGTPSILPAAQLQTILEAVRQHFDTSCLNEVTIEVNPATNINFGQLKEIGFNRISIGVQSFNNNELCFLGRLHNAATASSTIANAKQHFDNVSIDLIYGVPSQTLQQFEQTLDRALDAGVQHISAYSLTFEPKTELTQMQANRQCAPIDVDTECDMYELLCSRLAQAGLHQYEVSNFAATGRECLHNKGYWQRRNYIGLGASAHSLLANVRWANTKNIEQYIQQITADRLPSGSAEELTAAQVFEETIFLGLRAGGIEQELLNHKQRDFMQWCVKAGYATQAAGRFVLTAAGRFVTDSIVLKLV